ncbi:hypothetical protein MNV49_005956 [Pseudohyphozyma bogoriensis]|nr:hypothetical protein MNV49_005956 [Pseudohyphozyma bogoriensis]
MSNAVPYDPFKVDVYQTGSLIKEVVVTVFQDAKVDTSHFNELVNEMMGEVPERRPAAVEALTRFQLVPKTLPS